MVKVPLSKPNPILFVRMNNRLKEFEELLLDNTLTNMFTNWNYRRIKSLSPILNMNHLVSYMWKLELVVEH
jgi:hypothetical protein